MRHVHLFSDHSLSQSVILAGDEFSKYSDDYNEYIDRFFISDDPVIPICMPDKSLPVSPVTPISNLPYSDSPLAVLFSLKNISKSTVYLVGFDGYHRDQSSSDLSLYLENQKCLITLRFVLILLLFPLLKRFIRV